MGSTYGPCKKEVQPNTNMRRFLHRVKRCLAGSPLSSTSPEHAEVEWASQQTLRKGQAMFMDPWIPRVIRKIKKTITSGLSLAHYDPTLDIIVASDASSYGISACILHKLPDGSRKAVATSWEAIFPNRERGSRDNIHRHKIPQIPTWKTVHTTNRP